MAERFLLADVGGTNTRLGLAEGGLLLPDSVRRYRNADYLGLDEILSAYLEASPTPIDALCAAVAGPVRGGQAQLTNHSWLIDAAGLQAATDASAVYLINDLQAQGHALDDLPPGAAQPLFEGKAPPVDAPRLVLNIGTGCNVAVVHRMAGGLFVPAAESGHSTLPHGTGATAALYEHLRETHPHLPIEAALSGPGLADIHRHITGTKATPAEVIAAFNAGNGGARETLRLFATLLGQVAGNFALHHLPMGGIYLSGGVARAVAPHLSDLGFLPAFTDRGPYTHIARAMPVSVITEDGFALRGCARYLGQVLPRQTYGKHPAKPMLGSEPR
ncbi:glucokinase [Roseovarius amoyensis]|uniref:glucokinase n=1 Tax=Roseovarius amoyensis TaxID=2211448 RepID=UPI000DBE3A20|nr:glucokinase [Roseovarius amoyensis]